MAGEQVASSGLGLAGLVVVFFGGMVGTGCRVTIIVQVGTHGSFPVASFLINIAGSIAIGWFAGAYASWLRSSRTKKLAYTGISVGVLGGFTTYGAVMTDAVVLWQADLAGTAAMSSLGSIALGIYAAFVALRLGKATAARREQR